MDKSSRILQSLFSRIPVFTIALSAYALIFSVAAPSAAIHTVGRAWFLIIPFMLLFILREMDGNVKIIVGAQSGVYAVCMLGAYFFVNTGRVHILLMIIMSFFFVYVLCAKNNQDESPLYNAAIGINLFLALMFTFSNEPSHAALASVFIPVALLNICCRFIGKYYANLYFITQLRWWPHQSKKMAARFIKRSAWLMYATVGIAAAVLSLSFLPRQAPRLDARHFTVSTEIEFFNFVQERMEIMAEESETAVPDRGTEDVFPPEPEARDIAENSVALDDIIVVVAVTAAAIVIAVCVLLYKRAAYEEEPQADIEEEIIEARPGKARRRFKVAERRTRSPNAAVRQAFRRKVTAYKNKGLPVKISDTALLITNEINRKEDISDLSALYHTARYSGESVSRLDARRVGKFTE